MEDEGYTSPAEDPIPQRVKLEDDDYIPWEEIATLPVVQNRHLYWECLKAPFPYRRMDFIPTKAGQRLALFFCSDDTATSSQLVDHVWKVSRNYFGRNFHCGDGDGDNTNISNTSTPNADIQQLKLQGLMPKYIPLKQFIQHSLHLLAGRESLSFSLIQEIEPNVLFRKNKHIFVHGFSSGALLSFSKPLILCGSLYKKLSSAINVSYQGYSRGILNENSKCPSVFIAFLKFVGDYLKLQQTILMLKAPSISTLTRLLDFVKPFLHQLEILNKILDSQVNGNPSDLLSELNQLMFIHETPFIADLIRSLFLTCSSSYLRHISDWIFRGELGSRSASEFHISRGTIGSFEDRRFWTKQFVQKEKVPLFLEDSISLIFETGKGINLLSTIQNMISRRSSNSLFCYDTDVLLEPVLSFDEISKLRSNWDIKLYCFFEENSHLLTAVHDAIEEVVSLSCSTNADSADLNTLQESCAEFQNRIETVARSTMERKQEKQMELRRILDGQIQEAKEIKIRQKIQDDIEQKKIDEFIQRKDNEKREEDRRFALKYNYHKRFATDAHEQVDGVSLASSEPNLFSSSPPLPEVVNVALQCTTRSRTEILHKTFFGDSVEILEDSINLSKLAVTTTPSAIGSLAGYHEDSQTRSKPVPEEKFNPDKLIVRDPPPYELSFTTTINSQPIISLSGAISAGCHLPAGNTKRRKKWDTHCINYFISDSILIPVHAQNRMVNTALLHYIIAEQQLYHHISAINSFLCLQNGLFCRFLNELLITEVSEHPMYCRDDLKQRSGRFNVILAEALRIAMETEETNQFVKNLTFSLARDHEKILEDLEAPGNSKASSEFQLLNLLRLNYSVNWPLNIILTDDMLLHYEKIFGFLMQISRAERLLEQVFCLLKCKSSRSVQLQRLHHFRFQFLHFVRSVRNYVNVTVIHSAWTELCSTLKKLNTVEKIYEYLVGHVKNIAKSCLLGEKGERLMKLLSSKLRVIESFCSRIQTVCKVYNINWSRDDEMPAQIFQELCLKFSAAEELGTLFTKCAYKLTRKGVYPKVAFFFELYNFNEFFQPVLNH